MLGLKFHLMKFAGDRRGATLIEYAIVLIIALALLTLIVEVGGLAKAVNARC